MKTITRIYDRSGAEPFIWTAAIVILAIWTPGANGEFTICPHQIVGLGDCPGCGLGRAVSYLLHGEIDASIRAHILGIPALLMLGFRTITLVYASFRVNRLTPLFITEEEPKP